jgi:hypothetical protein
MDIDITFNDMNATSSQQILDPEVACILGIGIGSGEYHESCQYDNEDQCDKCVHHDLAAMRFTVIIHTINSDNTSPAVPTNMSLNDPRYLSKDFCKDNPWYGLPILW